MIWNKDLEGEGLNIAASNEKRIRVLAGPGSGKTFCLMRRIARLLEEGVDPESILLVTFTRTAASDLKQELKKLKVKGVKKIKAGTLHSFCYGILQRDTVLQITGRQPRPLFKYEIDLLIKDLMKKTNLGKRQIEKKIKAFESAWAMLQTDTPGWPANASDRLFHNQLIEYLKYHEAMLIGEVIPETLKYIKNNPSAEERKKYKYVFVDEFQDLNKAEQELISIIAKKAHYMVIGDEDQSIYEKFRYAHPEGIRKFHYDHKNTIDYNLSECRRCPTDVVKVADTFIQNNLNRENRRLRPRSENDKGKIYSIQWPSFEEEADGIVSFIEERIRQGVNAGDILVMCPRRQLGYAIKYKLRKKAIEAHSFFNEEILDEEDAQKAVTFLKLLVNINDKVALRCWIGIGSKTTNSSGYSKILDYSMHKNITPLNTIQLLARGQISINYTSDIVLRYNELEKLITQFSKLSTTKLIEKLFPESEEWAQSFYDILKKIDDTNSFEDILNEINYFIINPELPLDVDYVRIMSLHKSKGLTSDISIICGVIEGLIPRIDTSLNGEEATRFMEEQRRLFFVGITRPKKELIISNVSSVPKKLAYTMGIKVPWSTGQFSKAIASSFLNQLGGSFPETILGEDWIY